MQWLNNSILKDVRINESQETIAIETILPVIPTIVIDSTLSDKEQAEQRRLLEEEEAKEREAARLAIELEKTKKLKEEILSKAQEEAQALLLAAQQESEQIREVAYQEAFEKGEQAGTATGYQDGMEQATVIARDLLQTAQENAEAFLMESQQYVKDKKAEWTEGVVSMAEALIKKQFELDEQTILSVLEPLWIEIEGPDQLLVVRTNPQHVSVLKEKLEEKKKDILNFRYVILKEESYSPYQVEIESDEMLLTFDLQKELEEFLNQLKKDEGKDEL